MERTPAARTRSDNAHGRGRRAGTTRAWGRKERGASHHVGATGGAPQVPGADSRSQIHHVAATWQPAAATPTNAARGPAGPKLPKSVPCERWCGCRCSRRRASRRAGRWRRARCRAGASHRPHGASSSTVQSSWYRRRIRRRRRRTSSRRHGRHRGSVSSRRRKRSRSAWCA